MISLLEHDCRDLYSHQIEQPSNTYSSLHDM